MKVGEGDLPAEEPTEATYQKQLDRSSGKFLEALTKYNKSESSAEQDHLKSIMDLQMGLIQSAVNELKQQGMHKGADKLGKDYSAYMNQQTNEHYIRLHDDVETLREYTKPH